MAETAAKPAKRSRLMGGAAVAVSTALLPPPDPDRAILRTLGAGLVEANRAFDKTLSGVRYAGRVFNHGAFFGMCAIRTTDQEHSVAVTRERIGEVGLEAAVAEAVDELRAWASANG